ncbi:nuclear transport factor 2 family protein [Devosia sp. A369]
MTFEDYYEIQQVIARYGHVIDAAIDQLDTVFTPDCVYDMTGGGGPVVTGIAGILTSFTGSPVPPSRSQLEQQRPGLSHHTTNVEIIAERDGEADVRSKFFRLAPNGVAIGQYRDVLVRTPVGWRIARRGVIAYGA